MSHTQTKIDEENLEIKAPYIEALSQIQLRLGICSNIAGKLDHDELSENISEAESILYDVLYDIKKNQEE